jgi:hypothetical protein
MKPNLAALFLLFAAIVFGAAPCATAQGDNGPTSSLRFIVVRDSDGKPVRSAQIVLHPVSQKGKQTNGEMELKTDPSGHADIDGIPYGSLRVQVLAPHFQTFGEDYDVNKAQMEITVKLKHPGDQYSIYEDHGAEKKPQ